jgi:phosphotransferase system IIB component
MNLDIIASLVNPIVGLIGKVKDGANTVLNYNENYKASINNYVLANQSSECILLNDKIVTNIDACTAKKMSGFEGVFKNYNNQKAICTSDVKNNYSEKVKECYTSQPQKKSQINNLQIILLSIILLIILILIFKK